eukprot:TRINITY_DN222_c0_g1_i14.p1 TRINITY_DN222_c0_g1~~TRINITY_DN222_c0_g1_i14.p1  ORF type:complete len:275 (+),score=26.94 TRINITY_DN222_c0_g1_i14:287-1111(+)
MTLRVWRIVARRVREREGVICLFIAQKYTTAWLTTDFTTTKLAAFCSHILCQTDNHRWYYKRVEGRTFLRVPHNLSQQTTSTQLILYQSLQRLKMASMKMMNIPTVSNKKVVVVQPKVRQSGFVSNATIQKSRAMMVWQPFNNKFFETFSFLPPLTDDQISKQVDYILRNNWTPCLEFAASNQAYAGNENTIRMGPVASTYQDNRYWTMWKLPMFGCTDGSQVLQEIGACTKAFPEAYIRLVCFDANRQVQISGFLVHRPPTATDYRLPADRQV